MLDAIRNKVGDAAFFVGEKTIGKAYDAIVNKTKPQGAAPKPTQNPNAAVKGETFFQKLFNSNDCNALLSSVAKEFKSLWNELKGSNNAQPNVIQPLHPDMQPKNTPVQQPVLVQPKPNPIQPQAQAYHLYPANVLPGEAIRLKPGEKFLTNPPGFPPGLYIARPVPYQQNVQVPLPPLYQQLNHGLPLNAGPPQFPPNAPQFYGHLPAPQGAPAPQVRIAPKVKLPDGSGKNGEPHVPNMNQYRSPQIQTNNNDVQALSSKKENLSPQERLQVISHLRQQVNNNPNLSPKQRKNINETLNAAEHLTVHEEYWKTIISHIDKMYETAQVVKSPKRDANGNPMLGPDGKPLMTEKKVLTKEQYTEIKFLLSSKLGLLSHPEAGEIQPLLKSFSQILANGYLTAVENQKEDSFLQTGFGTAEEVCFEARTEPIQIWLQGETVTDDAVMLRMDDNKKDHYVALGHAYTVFKEIQLRACFEKHFKADLDKANLKYGIKMNYSGKEWEEFKKKVESDPRFKQEFNNDATFRGFLAKEVLPNEPTLKNGQQLTAKTIDNLLQELYAVADPFED